MVNEIDVRNVCFYLDFNTYSRWVEICKSEVPKAKALLAKKGIYLRARQIPFEKFRILEDGSGEIFVTLPEGIEIKMSVPPDAWVMRGN